MKTASFAYLPRHPALPPAQFFAGLLTGTQDVLLLLYGFFGVDSAAGLQAVEPYIAHQIRCGSVQASGESRLRASESSHWLALTGRI